MITLSGVTDTYVPVQLQLIIVPNLIHICAEPFARTDCIAYLLNSITNILNLKAIQGTDMLSLKPIGEPGQIVG